MGHFLGMCNVVYVLGAVSHSLALDAQGYSVNDIIHILMAEGGQA